MGRGKYHHKIAAIQFEQLKLVKVQRELEGLMDKVSESINALKVEELHLKSNAVAEMKIEQQFELQSTSTTDEYSADIEAHVNQQQIDLDMFVTPIKGDVAEVEEEDSD